jgi:hypothetical protein
VAARLAQAPPSQGDFSYPEAAANQIVQPSYPRSKQTSSAILALRPGSESVDAEWGETQRLELVRCSKFSVGIRVGAVWQRPQARLTIEALPAQCPSHLFPVKSFCFSDHMLNAGSVAKRTTKTDGYDEVRHCFGAP